MFYNPKRFADINKAPYLNHFPPNRSKDPNYEYNFTKYHNQPNHPIPLYNNYNINPNLNVKKTHNLKAINANSISQRNNIWSFSRNNLNIFFPEISKNPNILIETPKPMTAYELRRPEEKLRKGQNQLILERLQEKFQKQITNKRLAQTNCGFYTNKMNNRRGQYTNTVSARRRRRKIKSREIIDMMELKKEKENKEEENKNKEDIQVQNNKEKNVNFIRTIAKDFYVKKKNIKKENKIKGTNKSYEEYDIKDDNKENNDKNIYENIINPKTTKNTNFIKDEDKIKKPKKCISTRQLKTLYTLSLTSDFSFTKINEKHSKKNSNTSNNNTSNNFSSKTSSNFFKAESKSPFNINNLINRVIENNKKAAAAKSKDFFGEIGKDFMNNHMRKTNTNFYQSSSSNRYQNQKENINPKQPKTLNSLEITLLNPIEWRKHEEIWANISSLKFAPSDLEKHLIPPNETDVLVSSYCKMNPFILNFCSFSNISNANSSNNSNYLSFVIDDTMKNPKLEMKKWKEAYKRVILRWHPDKLLNVLKEVKFKDENKRTILRKKASMLINNMNNLYKQILEILRKILQRKNLSDNDS